jgi:hypothetical protein
MKRNPAGPAPWREAADRSFQDLLKDRRLACNKVRPLTANQATYLKALDEKSVVICTGPWGTGKTWLACAKAVEQFRAGQVDRIVLSRPLAECGEPMGWMPGGLYEKVVDMMMPLIEALEEFLGPAEFQELMGAGKIVICPLEKMRGRTMKRAFVILDEAQNATRTQLVMFLSRYGSGRMVLCGDYTQSDLPYAGPNSLYEVSRRIASEPNPDVGVVELAAADIVRSGLAKYFHGVLTKPFDLGAPAREQEGGPFGMVACPGCDGDLWYPRAAERDDRLVGCPACHRAVELRDRAGRLDPAVIEKPSRADLSELVPGSARRPAE